MTTQVKKSLRAQNAAPSFVKSSLALGIATAMFLPLTTFAADAREEAKAEARTQLNTVKVQDTAIDPNPNAEPGVPYKAKFSGDERHTRPLAETPQNITVLTKTQIDDSGYTDLRQILDAQPGITLGTGENGNAFGDRYIIRGQEARSDVFVDGLRDPGMTTRESFAVDQIEISKGPNSSFAGRGTAGGAINAVTKQATTDYDFTELSTGFGTDKHTRIALDTNQKLSDEFAVRANFLYGYEEVPDRAPADRERKGAALSGLYTPSEDLEIVLDYYGLEAEDTPDMGGFLISGKPAKDVPVYAQLKDFQDSDVDTFTARVKYRFNSDLRLTNITRKGTSDNNYVVTGARANTTDVKNPGGSYPTIILSTHTSWQEVDYLANQTNLFLDSNLFGLDHEFIFSLEYTDHKVLNGFYASAGLTTPFNCLLKNTTTPSSPTSNLCVVDSNGKPFANINTFLRRDIVKDIWDIDWAVKATSASIMDTVDLSEDWTLFAGLRADSFDFDLGTQNRSSLGVITQGQYDYSDTLINGHIGITYDLTPVGNIYLSYATSSDINGGESDVGTSSGYGGVVVANGAIVEAKPEDSKNIELGTKWNIFDEQLLLTAAVFQIDKSNIMEGRSITPPPGTPAGTNAYVSDGFFNSGENRVRGIEFGATGKVTDKLTVQAGVTIMDAEVTKSALVTSLGTGAAAVSAPNTGKTLSNFAEKTGVVQAKYQFTDKFALGAAAKYESERFAGQPDTAAAFDPRTGAYSQPVPAYTVYDLFATYDFNKNLDARLNIGNVTDKDYYLAAYRSGSFLYKGDARTVRLTLNYDF